MNLKLKISYEEYCIILFYSTIKYVVLSLIENRVNCIKLLYLKSIRQYAAKHKSINYYTIMIPIRIGFMKVQRLVSE